MNSETSLESLLQTLVNSPEEDKRALTRAAVGLLREVCNAHIKSNYSKFKNVAEYARNVLDQVLIGKVDDGEEEEFLESGEFTTAEPEIDIAADDEEPLALPEAMELSPLQNLVNKWNNKAELWLQITLPETGEVAIITALCKSAAAIRSNLVSAAVSSRFNKEEIKRFDRYWKYWTQEIAKLDYEFFPAKFGRLDKIPQGDVIYSCRPRVNKEEIALVMPGLRKKEQIIAPPLTLVTLPHEVDFPQEHPDADLPYQWRALLGELELLIRHLELQGGTMCAIEAINKNRIEPLAQCRQSILNEIRRRGDALRNTVRKEESIYRLATNYWRVEECFWAIFHDDERPRGYSFFDRLRRRVQSWHTTIRKSNKLYVRDFDPVNDSLTSINKYMGNIILQTKQSIQPGKIIRELRPAIIVKVLNSTRLLKGRVIAT